MTLSRTEAWKSPGRSESSSWSHHLWRWEAESAPMAVRCCRPWAGLYPSKPNIAACWLQSSKLWTVFNFSPLFRHLWDIISSVSVPLRSLLKSCQTVQRDSDWRCPISVTGQARGSVFPPEQGSTVEIPSRLSWAVQRRGLHRFAALWSSSLKCRRQEGRPWSHRGRLSSFAVGPLTLWYHLSQPAKRHQSVTEMSCRNVEAFWKQKSWRSLLWSPALKRHLCLQNPQTSVRPF